MRLRRTQSGMTVLETMVVLAIVSIFAALSVAGVQAMMDRQKVSGAQHELMLVAQEARQKARSTLQPVRLSLFTAMENGVSVTRLRWEALACQDSWGSVCPMSACENNACGASGCVCTEQGEPVTLPRGLDAAPLDGLCWLGTQDPGGATPPAVVRTGGRACLTTSPRPTDGQLVLRRNIGKPESPVWKKDAVMVVDGLTGAVRSVDCGKTPAAPGCT
ncbi:prepilin-type N-terminal cleavage/methylation domain-containing protein [Pyxidicoccus parkwayensis]|uniref:Prepilin-type N-terminal cleavage/methylation domain-containing protein n=1 Tax=Pyxidicoccus parkwayensis TaxID=2813578 RepID=A0ABX7NMZ7_9BACT|nr:type II secretion system protein [Pyxidicoccus parkwaysis]QSQ20231.1 prepilin-type N-terminal cleavage/methylation domain-containing protein [Pyxidicoccus parkwaysis]